MTNSNIYDNDNSNWFENGISTGDKNDKAKISQLMDTIRNLKSIIAKNEESDPFGLSPIYEHVEENELPHTKSDHSLEISKIKSSSSHVSTNTDHIEIVENSNNDNSTNEIKLLNDQITNLRKQLEESHKLNKFDTISSPVKNNSTPSSPNKSNHNSLIEIENSFEELNNQLEILKEQEKKLSEENKSLIISCEDLQGKVNKLQTTDFKLEIDILEKDKIDLNCQINTMQHTITLIENSKKEEQVNIHILINLFILMNI
jgi:hypothetical protein